MNGPATAPSAVADPLRELTIGQIIAAAFRLYRDHFAALVMIALVPYLALLLVDVILAEAALSPAAELALLLAVMVPVNAAVLAAMTFAIGRAVLGEMPGPWDAYRGGLGRGLPAIIIAYTLSWAMISLGFLALIVPGLFMGGLLLPAVPAIVMERLGPFAALARAVRLTGPVAFRAMSVFSFVVLISGVLPLVFHLVVGIGPFSPLLGAILGAVTLPLAYAANVVLYVSVRAMAEGYGRAELAAELSR